MTNRRAIKTYEPIGKSQWKTRKTKENSGKPRKMEGKPLQTKIQKRIPKRKKNNSPNNFLPRKKGRKGRKEGRKEARRKERKEERKEGKEARRTGRFGESGPPTLEQLSLL